MLGGNTDQDTTPAHLASWMVPSSGWQVIYSHHLSVPCIHKRPTTISTQSQDLRHINASQATVQQPVVR